MKTPLITLSLTLSNFFKGVIGINTKQRNEANVNIYLDSNKEKAIIQWSGNGRMSLVEVYSVLGEKVQSLTLTGDTNQIDLSGQPNGAYIYRIMTETGKLIGLGKLIIQK